MPSTIGLHATVTDGLAKEKHVCCRGRSGKTGFSIRDLLVLFYPYFHPSIQRPVSFCRRIHINWFGTSISLSADAAFVEAVFDEIVRHDLSAFFRQLLVFGFVAKIVRVAGDVYHRIGPLLLQKNHPIVQRCPRLGEYDVFAALEVDVFEFQCPLFGFYFGGCCHRSRWRWYI